MVMISKIDLVKFSPVGKLRESDEGTEKTSAEALSFKRKQDTFVKTSKKMVAKAIDSMKYEGGPIKYKDGIYEIEESLLRDADGLQVVSRYSVGDDLKMISYSVHDAMIPEHTTYYENGHKTRKVYFWGDGETKRSESNYEGGIIKNTVFFARDGKTKAYEKVFDKSGCISDFLLYDSEGNFSRSLKSTV